jgi:hypothetical protein
MELLDANGLSMFLLCLFTERSLFERDNGYEMVLVFDDFFRGLDG